MVRMKCDVCGRDGAPVKTVRPEFHDNHETRQTATTWLAGPSPGASCSSECTALLCFPAGATPNEKALTARMWAARRAVNRGTR